MLSELRLYVFHKRLAHSPHFVSLLEVGTPLYYQTDMEIPRQAIIELQQLHHKQTGQKPSLKETEKLAQDLFCLFDTIYQPIQKDWLK